MRPSLQAGLALLLGALTAFLAAQWVGSGASSAHSINHPIVVAAVPVEAGTVLSPPQLTSMPWAGSSLPPQSIQNPSSLVGRVTRYPLVTGEPVLESKLAPVDARAGLSAVIAEGKRAISVRVNEVIGVAGFALPGSFVDVLVSGKDANQQAFSKMVITRAKVLAVAQDTTADPSKPKVTNAVTLELSPAEAEKLDLARSIGTLSLVLRNEADQMPWNSVGARVNDLLQTEAKSERRPAANAAPTLNKSSGPAFVVRSASPVAPKSPAAPATVVQEIRGLHMGTSP